MRSQSQAGIRTRRVQFITTPGLSASRGFLLLPLPPPPAPRERGGAHRTGTQFASLSRVFPVLVLYIRSARAHTCVSSVSAREKERTGISRVRPSMPRTKSRLHSRVRFLRTGRAGHFFLLTIKIIIVVIRLTSIRYGPSGKVKCVKRQFRGY